MGIVGGIFGLIIIIIIPIVVICCYRKQRGVTRRWDEFKLGEWPLNFNRILELSKTLFNHKEERNIINLSYMFLLALENLIMINILLRYSICNLEKSMGLIMDSNSIIV